MKPFARIIANGSDVPGSFADRLMAVEVQDEAEDKSDRVTITLDDRARIDDSAVVSMPALGLTLKIIMGYEDGRSRDMGDYLVDDISVDSPPRTLTISGRSANMPSSFRTPRSESYHQTTVGEVMDKVASRNGLQASVDPDVADVVVRHADQNGESDMAFATRLAGDYDATAKPVAGRLVVARKGTAKAASGAALPAITLSESDCSQWTFKYSARDEPGESGKKLAGADDEPTGDSRLPGLIEFNSEGSAVEAPTEAGKKGGVRAYWNDIRTGERKEVKVGKDPFHDLRYTYHNEAEAKAAVSSYRNKGSRGKASFSCQIGGRTDVQAEAKLILADFRPYMPKTWRIKSVSHRFEPGGGYVTNITAELFDEEQDDVAGGVEKTTPNKDDTIDKSAEKKAKKANAKDTGSAPLNDKDFVRFE